MDLVSIGSIIVAGIGAFSAIASQRAAARASVLNTQTTSRVDMEREAYERARNFDTETIRRQDEELDELRQRVRKLEDENNELRNTEHQNSTEIRRIRTDLMRQRQEVTFLRLRLRTADPSWDYDGPDSTEETPPDRPDPPQD